MAKGNPARHVESRRIRTAAESDLDKLTAHFERLSQPARHNRFMGAASNISRIARDCLMPACKADFFTLVVDGARSASTPLSARRAVASTAEAALASSRFSSAIDFSAMVSAGR